MELKTKAEIFSKLEEIFKIVETNPDLSIFKVEQNMKYGDGSTFITISLGNINIRKTVLEDSKTIMYNMYYKIPSKELPKKEQRVLFIKAEKK